MERNFNTHFKLKFALFAGLIGLSYCGDNNINGLGNVVISGKDNHVNGHINTLDGFNNVVMGNFNDINGNQNNVQGNANSVDGNGNLVIGSGNLVMGEGNFVEDSLSIRIDPNWGKNLKTQFDVEELQKDFFGQNTNQNFNQKSPSQYEQQLALKMAKQFEERMGNQGVFNNPAIEKLRQMRNKKFDM